MNLADLARRGIPAPWAEGDNIPWNEPGFSQRMLAEHLSQTHDHASRRLGTIDRQVEFIHQHALGGRTGRVLDLGCGPGLYASRLARLGHSVRGIDFSPASIAYARETAEREGLSPTFELADIRAAEYSSPDGAGYDLVMLLYGEFNVFCPDDARLILRKARAALRPGGRLLLEPHHEQIIRQVGSRPASWSAADCGLFCASPHLLLSESYWDAEARAATNRYYVVDAHTGAVARYAASYQAYSESEYRAVLHAAGFPVACSYPSLTGEPDGGDLYALLAFTEG